MKQYHYLYKTECTVTGAFYIRMHSTSDLDDGYLGSGTILWRSIKKHGKEKAINRGKSKGWKTVEKFTHIP